MKLIIAGGRNYRFSQADYLELNRLDGVSEVITGGCTGADDDGQLWAEGHCINVRLFLADWKRYGKAAGPIRNRYMAQYADALAVFPGGRGTSNMVSEAEKAGLTIYDFRGEGCPL